MSTMMERYLANIVPHGTTAGPVSFLDTSLRMFIGKIEDGEPESVCGHDAITRRELLNGKDPEKHCRVCGKNLDRDGIMRCNDFLVIRNKECRGPICGDCFTKKPDRFYRAYRRGLDAYNAYRKALYER